MKEGQIVKVSLLESSGRGRSRPALLLKKAPPLNDWLRYTVSGSLPLAQKELDILLNQSHPDFVLTGLIHPAIIRTAFIFTIDERIIEGTIGQVSLSTYNMIMDNLFRFLKSNPV